MAAESRTYGLSMGLKNAEDILARVQGEVQFAVNEECVTSGDCSVYHDFLKSGKPVFHIEYGTPQSRERFCLKGKLDAELFSTVIKNATLDLDGWVTYCDGTQTTTVRTRMN
jgi:hypothetical protein